MTYTIVVRYKHTYFDEAHSREQKAGENMKNGITVTKSKLYHLAKEVCSSWFSELLPKASECLFIKVTPFLYVLRYSSLKVELQFFGGQYILRWHEGFTGKGNEAYLADFAVADFGIVKV